MASGQSLEVEPRPRRRFRIGLRGLIVLVMIVGAGLGWIARQDRLARLQSARVAELKRLGVVVNDFHPTITCLIAMKFLGADSARTESKLVGWLDPGWFTRPRGFNAGYLPADRVEAVVGLVGQFGGDVVKEVRFNAWGNPPLCLLYLDQVPYDRLGFPRNAVTVIDHPRPTPAARTPAP